jgi:hypothetical protein
MDDNQRPQWNDFPRRANLLLAPVDALISLQSLIVIQMRRDGGARGGVGVNQME